MRVIVRLLIAIFLAATAGANGFQVGVRKVESLRTKLIREGKCGLCGLGKFHVSASAVPLFGSVSLFNLDFLPFLARVLFFYDKNVVVPPSCSLVGCSFGIETSSF